MASRKPILNVNNAITHQPCTYGENYAAHSDCSTGVMDCLKSLSSIIYIKWMIWLAWVFIIGLLVWCVFMYCDISDLNEKHHKLLSVRRYEISPKRFKQYVHSENPPSYIDGWIEFDSHLLRVCWKLYPVNFNSRIEAIKLYGPLETPDFEESQHSISLTTIKRYGFFQDCISNSSYNDYEDATLKDIITAVFYNPSLFYISIHIASDPPIVIRSGIGGQWISEVHYQ